MAESWPLWKMCPFQKVYFLVYSKFDCYLDGLVEIKQKLFGTTVEKCKVKKNYQIMPNH